MVKTEMANRLGGDGIRFRDLLQSFRRLGYVECFKRFRVRLKTSRTEMWPKHSTFTDTPRFLPPFSDRSLLLSPTSMIYLLGLRGAS